MAMKNRMLAFGVAALLGMPSGPAGAGQDLPTDEELVKACEELATENAVTAAERPHYLTQCVQDLQNSLQMEEADGIEEPIGMPPPPYVPEAPAPSRR
ncbi:MAG: hypothetical protein HQL66_05950 [Magnetococcales bacterium]|nr:hypothetical protein [Magnetococcales bacterium]